MGLSPHLCFWRCGFESTSLFLGAVGLSPHFFVGGSGFTLISLGIIFKRGIFCLVFVLCWKFIYICLTFTHSSIQIFFGTVGRCKCWTVCFLCFWA